MRKTVFLLVFIMLFTVRAVYAEELKIGYVDLVKTLNESDTGKKAKTDLEFLIKSKQSTLDEKGKTIEKLKGDLEKQSSVLSQEARKSKEEEMERLIREYQRLVADSQNEVKKKESELTGEIIKEIREIIQKIGQDEGFTIILENADGLILFSRKEIDLTEKVIKKYNESKAKSKK
ncbi:MAG: OmpH family outer membrane protein [Nitrospirota bacterium]